MGESKDILSGPVVEPATSSEATFLKYFGSKASSGVVDSRVTGAFASDLSTSTTAGSAGRWGRGGGGWGALYNRCTLYDRARRGYVGRGRGRWWCGGCGSGGRGHV